MGNLFFYWAHSACSCFYHCRLRPLGESSTHNNFGIHYDLIIVLSWGKIIFLFYLQNIFYLAFIPVLFFIAAVLMGYGLQISIVIKRSQRNTPGSQRKFLQKTLWMISTVCGFLVLAIAIAINGLSLYRIPQVGRLSPLFLFCSPVFKVFQIT